MLCKGAAGLLLLALVFACVASQLAGQVTPGTGQVIARSGLPTLVVARVDGMRSEPGSRASSRFQPMAAASKVALQTAALRLASGGQTTVNGIPLVVGRAPGAIGKELEKAAPTPSFHVLPRETKVSLQSTAATLAHATPAAAAGSPFTLTFGAPRVPGRGHLTGGGGTVYGIDGTATFHAPNEGVTVTSEGDATATQYMLHFQVKNIDGAGAVYKISLYGAQSSQYSINGRADSKAQDIVVVIVLNAPLAPGSRYTLASISGNNDWEFEGVEVTPM